MDVRIPADAERFWTALPFIGLRFGVACTALAIAVAISGEFSVLESVSWMVGLAVLMTLAVGGPMALWWVLRPGLVSYVVTEGELRVLRGAKVVRRHPCADITALTFEGGLSWRELTLRNWLTQGIDGWPELKVDRLTWPTPRMLVGPRAQPAILLWGVARCASAEQALRQAVTAHGAQLRDDR